MQELSCNSCGAPLKIEPQDFQHGYATCPFCDSVYSLGPAAQPELDADVRRGLKMLSMMDRFFEIAPPDLNEPAQRPTDTKIELRNVPGYSLQVKIPRRGLSLGAGFMGVFTAFWCGFMVIWNAIGISQGQWAMVAFGLIHDAVGAGLLISVCWKVFGREELIADHGEFQRVLHLFGFKRRRVIPVDKIKDVIFKIVSRNNNTNSVTRGLFLAFNGTRQRIASNTNRDEQRWLRTELRKFLKLDTA
ncbi:MAG: hypothetical protein P9M14_00365 [Candidatus Alcyoniella australis]|nr:hypothetical protein [Candidatus Alcyoniella australis]